jgi:phenylpropionate dioxygenase-like ring-hydroxylating dioxygenase large terminal subunit
MKTIEEPLHAEKTAPKAADFERALRRGWFPVAYSSDLATPVQARILGVELVVFRDEGGRARVASNQCPHRGASLAMGQVVGGAIQCPYHGWQWDGGTARCHHIPAIGPDGAIPPAARLRTYEAHERYGVVWATLSTDPVGQVPLFEEVEAQELATDWLGAPSWDVGCNACAAIENFRDVAHLPFVHRATMGAIPAVVEPLKPNRQGFHAYLTRIENPYELGTSDEAWEATHQGTVHVQYHAIAPSAVAIVVGTSEDAGKRVVVFAVAPTSLESTRWFFIGANTAGYARSNEEAIALGRAITDEDAVILEGVRPRGFEGLSEQVHCVADGYTLKYREAFMSFVRAAATDQ